jgi:hypothetical protein
MGQKPMRTLALILEDAILRTCSLCGKTMNPKEPMTMFDKKPIFRAISVIFIIIYCIFK